MWAGVTALLKLQAYKKLVHEKESRTNANQIPLRFAIDARSHRSDVVAVLLKVETQDRRSYVPP